MGDPPAKLYWISKNRDENKKKQKKLIVQKYKKWTSNLLFYSDNIDAMDYLFKHGFSGKIDLVYIDPPFWSGEKYFHRIKNVQNVAFEDIWKHQINKYLDMIYSRLCAIHKLISQSGSIFVHLDWHIVHYVKVIMDEIFGHENFRNEILVKRGRRKNLLYQFPSIDRMHSANDTILWYSKSASTKFPHPLVKYTSNSKWMGFWSNVNRPTMRYNIFGIVPERGQWKWCKARALKAIENYNLYRERFSSISLEEYWSQTNKKLEFIRKRKDLKYAEYWIPPKTHRVLDNVWMDIETYNYSTGYGTEKHTELLERIIGQFSKAGDLVADFFCGSGTTLLVAQKLARKWIGCDSSLSAMDVTKRRLEDSKFNLVNITSL
ncbi:MAG: site-specific DNA-methyltransferase [Thermoproteota archaeon]|jgi:adenine-specific DNA-methyltransferase|nr:site-specific DNA-methyltransferase [Thermoproteota archaeon]